nr:hypothetical protein [uncultured Methanoregula sp.]
MELFDDLTRETKRTEEEIRKAAMKKEVGELKEQINRTGHEISHEIQNESPAPSATADEE